MKKALLVAILFIIPFAFSSCGGRVSVSSVKESESAIPEEQFVQASIVYVSEVGFEPKNISTPAGQTTTFINNTTSPVRIASDPHPSHNGLSNLNIVKLIYPKASAQVTIDKIGIFGYHNEKNPSMSGKIKVLENLE